MAESTERLEEIESDLRADHATAKQRAETYESEGKEPGAYYERGLAYAYDIAANRIAGEISEIRYA